jgi:putative effector of murein hydrolase
MQGQFLAGLIHRAGSTLLFGVVLTPLAYWIGVRLQRLLGGSPLVNPVLVAMVLLGTLLLSTGISYRTYFSGAWIIHFLLGPATVALAVPLADSLRTLRHRLPSAIPAIAAGSLVSAASGLWLVKLLGGSEAVAASMAPKAATTPIAIGITAGVGGEPPLTAALAILGGILVAMALHSLVHLGRSTNWPALGVAAGTAGSGIGTARAFQLSEVAGSFAGLALGLNGLTTAIFVPLLVHLEKLR